MYLVSYHVLCDLIYTCIVSDAQLMIISYESGETVTRAKGQIKKVLHINSNNRTIKIANINTVFIHIRFYLGRMTRVVRGHKQQYDHKKILTMSNLQNAAVTYHPNTIAGSRFIRDVPHSVGWSISWQQLWLQTGTACCNSLLFPHANFNNFPVTSAKCLHKERGEMLQPILRNMADS